MEDLSKVSSLRLYQMYRNFAIAMLVIMLALTGCRILPVYLSPIVSLGGAGYLYYRIMHDRMDHRDSCAIVNYTVFFALIAYTFLIIIVNLLFSLTLMTLPPEMVFFTPPYIPTLILMPILFITAIVMSIRKHKMKMCLQCKVLNGSSLERGRSGMIMNKEAELQLRNMILLFGIISVITWLYYTLIYIDINQNARDWYVFIWFVVIAMVIDLVYFVNHYYSVYLSLKESGELIGLDELSSMPETTFLRFYVICGDNIFVKTGLKSKYDSFEDHIDTPFRSSLLSRNVMDFEAEQQVRHLTGISDGELRHFYSRNYNEYNGMSMNRYFYFLPGKPEDYQSLVEETGGEWMPFGKLKGIYSQRPRVLRRVFLADMNRLATVMITQKMFDEKGNPRFKVKGYVPSFTLEEVKNGNVDFQSDKWIKMAVFNSGLLSIKPSKMFKMKKGGSSIKSWTLM